MIQICSAVGVVRRCVIFSIQICSAVCVIFSLFLIGYAARTVPKGKTFGQQSLPRWYQYRQLVVTIIVLIHAHDQDVGDLGLFDNRDVLSVAHTSLQEASIGEP